MNTINDLLSNQNFNSLDGDYLQKVSFMIRYYQLTYTV